MKDIWRLLGIEATDNQEEIKRAFSEKLKVYHPEDDPEGFKALQRAYKDAMAQAKAAGRARRPGATLNQNGSFRDEKAEQNTGSWTVYETTEKESVETEKDSVYDFSSLEDSQENFETSQGPEENNTYDFSDMDGSKEPESKDRERNQSEFDQVFDNWGVDFEEVDPEELATWDEMAEQFREAEAVESLVDELCGQLGLIFSFQKLLQILDRYGKRPLFEKEEVKRGLEAHCLNAFIVGQWKDRLESVRRAKTLGMETLATYLSKVGLSEFDMEIGKDTTLEGWQEG